MWHLLRNINAAFRVYFHKSMCVANPTHIGQTGFYHQLRGLNRELSKNRYSRLITIT